MEKRPWQGNRRIRPVVRHYIWGGWSLDNPPRVTYFIIPPGGPGGGGGGGGSGTFIN